MHDDIRTALRQQESIGWLSCFKGFLSTHWKIFASMSMEDPNSSTGDTGTCRLRHIMMSLHELSLALWKGRNDTVNRDDITTDQRLHRREDLEIQHYYDHPEMLSTTDHHYCERPLQKILRSTPANRRRWLRQVKTSRHRRLQDLKSQSLMPQFFHRTSSEKASVAPDHAPRQRTLLEFFKQK
jgi:hypothetical protein